MTDKPLVGMNDTPWSGEQYPGKPEHRFAEASVDPEALFPPSPEIAERAMRIGAARRLNDWPALCQYRADNAALTASGIRPQVVFIGDSLTELWRVADPSLFSANVVNRGISGQTSQQIVARFYTDAIRLRPRVIHVLCGGNDIAGNTGPTTLEDYGSNMLAMFDMAKANGIAVIVGGLTPANGIPWQPEVDAGRWLPEVRTWLEHTAQQRGLVFADYHSALADEHGGLAAHLTKDGVHLTRPGYALMRPVALAAIDRALAQGGQTA